MLWQATRKSQRHMPCGLVVVPSSGRAINLTDSEKPYPGRWRL
jgi:hypothetical protein